MWGSLWVAGPPPTREALGELLLQLGGPFQSFPRLLLRHALADLTAAMGGGALGPAPNPSNPAHNTADHAHVLLFPAHQPQAPPTNPRAVYPADLAHVP